MKIAHPEQLRVGIHLQLGARDVLVVPELRRAAVGRAEAVEGAAQLVGIGLGIDRIEVGEEVDAVDEADRRVVHPLRADAVGLGIVLAPFVEDAGEQVGEIADARQDLRALHALGIAAGQADRVAVGRPHDDLGEEVVVVPVGRVGADRRPGGREFLAVAAGIDAQHLEVALAHRAGEGLGELLVGARIGALDAGIDVLAAEEIVARILGGIGHDAADRV